MKQVSRPWLIVACLYMALIWKMSSQSLQGIDIALFPSADKVIHFFEYGVLALLWILAFKRKQLFYICILVSLYGGIDEYHQSFVYSRSADFNDFIMDTLAAVVVCLGFHHFKKEEA